MPRDSRVESSGTRVVTGRVRAWENGMGLGVARVGRLVV